jgi:hypothetical protein
VFVVAGAVILVQAHRRARTAGGRNDGAGTVTALGVLTMLIGVGSVVQHGPAPSWNPVAHDPPLMGALALVGADAIADLTRRRLRAWWWLVPTGVVAVLAAVVPVASSVAQAVTAGVAVGATLLRARFRPDVRRRVLVALVILAVGARIGRLSRPGRPWCVPGGWLDTGLSGHAVWHVLAAAALVVIAPTLGRRRE